MMAIYSLRTQMIAPVSVREAFAVFEDPRNLPAATPPWLALRLLTPEPIVIGLGVVLDFALDWHGLPLKWQARITEYEPPFVLVEEQIRGPYRRWLHRHTFHPSQEGTVMREEVEYELPFGRAGDLAHSLLVSSELKDIFRFRQNTLNALICGGRARWTEPAITLKPRKNRL